MTILKFERLSADKRASGCEGLPAAGEGEMTVVSDHCVHLARLNKRSGSVYQRERALHRFAAYIAPTPVEEAGLVELRAFVDRRLPDGRRRANEYVAAETTHLIGFFRWLAFEGLRVDDPTLRLERPARKKGSPRPISPAHHARALHAAPDPTRKWYWIASYAGLRAFEIAPLRGEDYSRGRITVHDGKGGKRRVVPVPAILRAELAMMPRKGIWFPHGWDPDRPITGGQLDKRANRWLHEHDIPETLHQFRHWYGTMLREMGVDLQVIRDLMGHASVSTTEIYTEIGDDELDEAGERLPPPDELPGVAA